MGRFARFVTPVAEKPTVRPLAGNGGRFREFAARARRLGAAERSRDVELDRDIRQFDATLATIPEEPGGPPDLSAAREKACPTHRPGKAPVAITNS